MLKFLDKLVHGDLYNTRIKVTFINHIDNTIIDCAEIEQEYLPESFAKQLSVFIEDEEWLIINADPVHANQYTLDKKLTLRLKNVIASRLRKTTEHPAEKKFRFGTSTPG